MKNNEALRDIKAVLLDLDNTFLDSERNAAPDSQEVIADLCNRGIQVAVCTGRTYAMLQAVILPLFPKDQLHIVAGGGQIVSSEGEIFWESLISDQIVRDLVVEARKDGCTFGFARGDTYYAGDAKLAHHLTNEYYWKFMVELASEIDDWSVPLLTIRNLTPRLAKIIQSHPGVTAKVMKSGGSGREFADITAIDTTKATAAQVLSKEWNIPLTRIAMIGDGDNDLEVMELVGYPVAMANANAVIKSIAELHTPKNADQWGALAFLQMLREE